MTEEGITEHKNPRESPIKDIIPKCMLVIYQVVKLFNKMPEVQLENPPRQCKLKQTNQPTKPHKIKTQSVYSFYSFLFFFFPVDSYFKDKSCLKKKFELIQEGRSTDNCTAAQLFIWYHVYHFRTVGESNCEVLVQTCYCSVSCHHFLTPLLHHSYFSSGSNSAEVLTQFMNTSRQTISIF